MIARFLQSLLDHAATLDPADGRLFLVGCAGFPLAWMVHLVSGILFWHLGYDVLVLWEIGATALWFTLWVLLLTKRIFLLALWLPLFVEIPLRAALATYYMGFTAAFWLYLFVSFMIIPLTSTFSPVIKALLAVYTIAAMLLIASLPALHPPVAPLDPSWELFFMVSNVFSVAAVVGTVLFLLQIVVLRAEAALAREYDRAEGLLNNILPDPVALRLKDGQQLIADEHSEVSVLFADIVNFTEASAKLKPAELVQTLNLVFTEFDRLAENVGAEKIKTIGDAYMAVVGVPQAKDRHAEVAVNLAIDMLAAARKVSDRTHFPIELRIGVNSGPVVAGVIGQSKFAYDLWGDAVNVAARMEAHSEPGMILATEQTVDLLKSGFIVSPDGTREVKGKGSLPVFSVRAA